MSFVAGWRGTDVIAREFEEMMGWRNDPLTPRCTVFGPNSCAPFGMSERQLEDSLIKHLKNKIMSVKAKFVCGYVQKTYAADGKTQNGVNVSFYAVYGGGEDNKSWSEATPSGQLNMFISNPAVFGAFEAGKNYFLTLESAD